MDSKQVSKEEMRISKLGQEWYNTINYALDTIDTQQVATYVAGRRKQVVVYPHPNNVFRAFKMTPYKSIKVVILGQDPYHNGIADGLAFSCSNQAQTPPSLAHIHRAVKEMNKASVDENTLLQNELDSWSKQGVFLLNTVLTVEAGLPNSHKNRGWEYLVQETMLQIGKLPNVVFLLWGKEAQAFNRFVVNPNHQIIMAEHPAAASYGNRAWMYNNCFEEANRYLEQKGEQPINWGSIIVF